jgi:hypothetical protein
MGGRSSFLGSDKAKPIPITAARAIGDEYGFDQVVIIARRVGAGPDEIAEHVTTWGLGTKNCTVAARIGDFLKHKVMGWTKENEIA